MRIAICSDIYLPQLSGVADSIATLARHLRTAGHTVRIYAPRMAGAEADPDVVRLPAFAVPGSGGGLQVVAPAGMLADMRRFAPDIVHTHTAAPVGLAALHAARRLGTPLLGTDHTLPAFYLHYARLDIAPARALVRRFASWYFQRCDFVTAPSRMMLDELAAHGCDRPRAVVSNPIETDRFRPLTDSAGLKRRLGIGAQAVLLFGRVAVEKNLDLAADVFADVAAQSAAELVVIGDGPARASFAAMLTARGLAGRCRFLGLLRGEALVEAINACDVYLVTSLSETQSMTMLQAAACGLPVVAIRAGGLPEYVREGDMGTTVEGRDGLAAAVLGLLGDRVRAAAMGRAGRSFVCGFAPEAIAARFAGIYADLVATRRRGRDAA